MIKSNHMSHHFQREPLSVDVSIVTANYNNAAYLSDYFMSVINSSVWPQELIIVDDGSTDNSKELIEGFTRQFGWIKAVFSEENHGVANATNVGLNLAKSKYILRIDSDDMLHSARIEQQFSFMESHPEVDVLGGNCEYFVSRTGHIIRHSAFPVTHSHIAARIFRGENGVLNGTVMAKSGWFKKIQYRQEMVWAEDYDIFARMLKAGARFSSMKEPFTKVRIHQRSATSNLEYDTIRKAWLLSRELFDNKRPEWVIKMYYLHLNYYRKYLLEPQKLKSWFYLGIALLCGIGRTAQKIRENFRHPHGSQ